MRARRLAGLWLLGLAVLAGCSSTRETTISDAPTRTGIETKKGQKIVGYVTRDGIYHKYEEGHVRFHSPDTLEFWQRERMPGTGVGKVIDRFFVHRDSINSIEARHADTEKTVFTVLGVTAFVAVAAIGIIAASSCPLLYSYDGDRYVLDGEPYGGAITRALERTDWSEMEHVVPVDGSYRLLVTNEMDETQHTNRLSLLVVDHPPGSTVVMDDEGAPHAFSELTPPLSARDEDGADLLPWLRERDRVAWDPDLERLSGLDSIQDTRSHIVLEFPMPRDPKQAHLVAHVSTGLWGSHMLRQILRLRGSGVKSFYAMINSSPLARQRLHEWNIREEVFMLSVEVETDRGWERRGVLRGGGPVVGESRAIPLDLSGIPGPTVRVRLHPPIGYWSLDSFHLAGEELVTETQEMLPVHAKRPSGRDVLAMLLKVDGAYLDFPEMGDRAEVWFHAPPANAGMERSVFAQTRGWYEIHLRDLGPPNTGALARLNAEPGYPVRLGLEEYREYRRRGVLVGSR